MTYKVDAKAIQVISIYNLCYLELTFVSFLHKMEHFVSRMLLNFFQNAISTTCSFIFKLIFLRFSIGTLEEWVVESDNEKGSWRGGGAQCGNYVNVLIVMFYVKSISSSLSSQKWPFWLSYVLWFLLLWKFLSFHTVWC